MLRTTKLIAVLYLVMLTSAYAGEIRTPDPILCTKSGVKLDAAVSLEWLRRCIDANGVHLNNIYQRRLQKVPGLEGGVTLSIRISSSGAVEEASVTSVEISDEEFLSRIQSFVKKLKFPESPSASNLQSTMTLLGG